MNRVIILLLSLGLTQADPTGQECRNALLSGMLRAAELELQAVQYFAQQNGVSPLDDLQAVQYYTQLNRVSPLEEELPLPKVPCRLLSASLRTMVEDFNALDCAWLSHPVDNEVFEARFLFLLKQLFDKGCDESGLFPPTVTKSTPSNL